MAKLRKPDFVYPLILAIVSAVLWAPRLRGPIDLRWDAGVYYILGTSLAEGKGYRLSNEPGDIRAVQYPPGLPALVALEEKFLGTQNTDKIASWLRRTYCAMFIAYILGAYALARRVFRPEYALLVGLICALSGDMLYLSDLLQAELPFALLTVLFVLAARPFARKIDDPPVRESPLRFALTSILGIATFLVRSAGIALLAAWIGEALLARRWRAVALRTIITLIPLIGWQAYVSHVRQSDDYKNPSYAYQRAPYQYYNVTYAENLLLIDSFHPELGNVSPLTLAKRTAINLTLMPATIGEAVSCSKAFVCWTVDAINRRIGRPVDHPIVPWKLAIYATNLFGVITILGMLVMLARRQWFIMLYLGATIALVCITPWPKQFLRYLSTVAPFLAMCTVAALTAGISCFAKNRNQMLRRAGVFICAMALAGIPTMEAIVCLFTFRAQHSPPGPGAPNLFYMRSDWISWGGAIEWIGEHSNPDDVIATSAPHMAYLKINRRSILPPMEPDTDKAVALLDSVPVRYVIIGSFDFIEIDQDYVSPMVKAHPDKWRLVYTVEDGLTKVFERVK